MGPLIRNGWGAPGWEGGRQEGTGRGRGGFATSQQAHLPSSRTAPRLELAKPSQWPQTARCVGGLGRGPCTAQSLGAHCRHQVPGSGGEARPERSRRGGRSCQEPGSRVNTRGPSRAAEWTRRPCVADHPSYRQGPPRVAAPAGLLQGLSIQAVSMAGRVRAAEAAPWVGSGFRVSGAEQGRGMGTKETPLVPGPGQEGMAGTPQAEASDPVQVGMMDSQPPRCDYRVPTGGAVPGRAKPLRCGGPWACPLLSSGPSLCISAKGLNET